MSSTPTTPPAEKTRRTWQTCRTCRCILAERTTYQKDCADCALLVSTISKLIGRKLTRHHEVELAGDPGRAERCERYRRRAEAKLPLFADGDLGGDGLVPVRGQGPDSSA
jgi:hypothetical protein